MHGSSLFTYGLAGGLRHLPFTAKHYGAKEKPGAVSRSGHIHCAPRNGSGPAGLPTSLCAGGRTIFSTERPECRCTSRPAAAATRFCSPASPASKRKENNNWLPGVSPGQPVCIQARRHCSLAPRRSPGHFGYVDHHVAGVAPGKEPGIPPHLVAVGGKPGIGGACLDASCAAA